MLFNSLLSKLFSVAMTANGLAIGAVGEFENRQPNLALKFHSSTNVQLLPSPPIAAIPC